MGEKIMSKNWYPVINYEKCIECGNCVDMCPHGVYNKEKSPRPVVIYTEGCIEGCHGCGSNCPAEAIEYFGDRELSAVVYGEGCGCGCGCGSSTQDCGCGCGSSTQGCGCNCD